MTKPLFKKKLLPTLIAVVVSSIGYQAACADEPQQAATATAADGAQVVEIHGIRDTLKKNLATKRDSQNVMESVSSEDIGKFPDKSLGDALQRVPGVTVENVLGVNRDVFIRGTNKDLNLVQLNGQDVASAYWWRNDKQSRGFSFDILPSEVIAVMDVYKSPSADQNEGSIGGTINVKTRKPFQFKDQLTGQFSVEEVDSTLSKKWDPQLSGLVNWKNDQNTFGVLLALNDQKQTLQRNGIENFTDGASRYNITNPQTGAVVPGGTNVMASWGGGTPIFQQDRKGTTENVVVEIRPNRQTDIAVNFLNTNMKLNNNNDNYLWIWGGVAAPNGIAGSSGNIPVTNPVFSQSANGPMLVGGTVNTANSGGNLAYEPIFRQAYVDSQVFDVDGTYKGDGFTVHGQAGATKAKGGTDHEYHLWFSAQSPITTNVKGNDTYAVDYSKGINPNDGSNVFLQNGSDFERLQKTTENYAQGDLTLDLNGSFVRDIKFGARLTDSTNSSFLTKGTTGPGSPGWTGYSLSALSSGPTPVLNDSPGALNQFAYVGNGAVYNTVVPMYNKGLVYVVQNGANYSIAEKTSAAYAKADYEVNKLRGDFGVRFVKTSEAASGSEMLTPSSPWTPITVDHSYTDALPSLNAVYDVNKDFVLRGAASRAMARPDWSQLSPALTPNGTTATYTSGNPSLKPIHSNQLEAGFEWYYAEASAFAATTFVKHLDSFVYGNTIMEMVNGVNAPVSTSVNSSSGASITGLELQVQQPIGYGFGAIANLTLTDAKSNATSAGQPAQVVGNSKQYFNFSTYYENNGFSARISYNYRSATYGAFDQGGQLITSPYGQWDANASYDINKNLTLFVTGVNLNNEFVRTNISSGISETQYENGSRYSLGLRGKF